MEEEKYNEGMRFVCVYITWKQGIPVEEKMKSDVKVNRTCVNYFENHYFWIGLPLFINVKLST